MRDFTLSTYRQLMEAYLKADYAAVSYQEFICSGDIFCSGDNGRTVILRHDVDKRPKNALEIAELEASLDVRGTFYFRIVPDSFHPATIEKIASLGHEIGYHYEDLSICRGDHQLALDHFKRSLEEFRKYFPVTTICMHGSPMSKWDSRDIWKQANYRDYGIVGEPYFDTDFSEVFYVSDTGRGWNKSNTSVRDKVISGFDLPLKNTAHMIALLRQDKFPRHVLQNIHPQRWFDNAGGWLQEYVSQNTKNMVKRLLYVKPIALENPATPVTVAR